MVRWVYVTAVLAGLATDSGAQDLPPLPQGPSPNYQLAKAVEKDGIVVVRFTRVEFRTKTVEVEKDGKKFARNIAESAWADAGIDVPVDGKEVRAFGADGKVIDPKDLPKRLARLTQVVVFVFGPNTEPKPDPFYLRALREDIVVFAAPAAKLFPAPPKK